MLEDYTQPWMHYLAGAIQICAALLIGLAAAQATVRSIVIFFRRNSGEPDTEQVRLKFGRWLVVALEFQVAADILRTAIAPTWDEIGQLAAIIVLRTLLNFFLQKEIERAARQESADVS
ncbi:MAG: DUF1622 domain-containing protein [Pirellulales bacterium]|nr:DUF1622 domain-containing protein [Pirellulales bacterium]